jgi:hypothetical protein
MREEIFSLTAVAVRIQQGAVYTSKGKGRGVRLGIKQLRRFQRIRIVKKCSRFKTIHRQNLQMKCQL